MNCDLCEKNGSVYNFNRTCCLARFVVKLPSLELRRGWLARLAEQRGEEFQVEVAAEVRRLWEERKAA
jgi:hypothetical protein